MSDIADIAIVGGGASGIYSAWRLAHASAEEVAAIRGKIGGEGPLRIRLYERSERIGGRLLSASPAALPEVPMEIGGMRYMDDHRLVKALVENKLEMGAFDQVVDSADNLAWLRRKRFTTGELGCKDTKLPYNLTEEERAYLTTPNKDGTPRSPSDLIFWAVYRQFPELEGMAPERIRPWLQTQAFVDGRPLHDIGFWNLLSRHLSNEGRLLALKTVGYDSLGANANAVDIVAENLSFTPGSKYHLFDEGFEAVLWTLQTQFAEAGGTVVLDKELESFDDEAGGEGPVMDLRFRCGAAARARAVVLAIPQAAIRALRKTGPVLDPRRAPKFRRLLDSVTSVPLYKLFVVYEHPWWHAHDPKLKAGRSVSDLPVRQCYYWHTDPQGGPSAIMAYNDEASVSFWGGYQTGPLAPDDTVEGAGDEGPELFHGPEGAAETGHDGFVRRRRINWRDHKAPKEMVHEMHRQLMEIHGVSEAPEPIDAAFMDWANPPYGGAVHFWNPGYRSWEIKKRMIQPVDAVNAFVVGESWSTVQTWVEGAFQTAEMFLGRIGMQPPPWAPDAVED